jgi:hypothetical protein
MGGRYGDVVSLEEVPAAIAQTTAMPTAAPEQPAGR